MIPATEALQRLREGNFRFVAGDRAPLARPLDARRDELVAGQQPFAIVLGCSDSRVPPELVFDQGLGDLFVIRVAGNIADPVELGSIEVAATALGVNLIVVLGHTHCAAVTETLKELDAPDPGLSPNLAPIIEHIRPAAETVPATVPADDLAARVAHVVRANVRRETERMRRKSPVLAGLPDLLIVGAEYSLETGEVDFFDGVPAD